jgi:hypothetical protein
MGGDTSEEDKMKEIDDFVPFDTQSLKPMTWWDWLEMKRIINALVEEVKEQSKMSRVIVMKVEAGTDIEDVAKGFKDELRRGDLLIVTERDLDFVDKKELEEMLARKS